MKRQAAAVVLFLVLFLCAVVQTGVLPYIAIGGAMPNLLFAVFFLTIFFADPKQYTTGVFASIATGFFFDVTLASYFGVSMAALLMVYVAFNLVARMLHELRGPLANIYFISGCAVFLLAYDGLLWLFARLFGFDFFITPALLVSVLYTVLVALVGFYLVAPFARKPEQDSQLKLL